jgi:hypothetical protein
MGVCRIKIVVAKSLFPPPEDDATLSSSKIATLSFVALYSSDTTIREVLQENVVVWDVITQNNNNSPLEEYCRLWDCTTYPCVDITPWPVTDFPDLQGPKSKTLFSAGWFPSGTILIIPHHLSPNQFSELPDYEDMQYKNRSDTNIATTTNNVKLEFQDPVLRHHANSWNNQLLPSHVVASVVHRFDNDHDTTQSNVNDSEIQARLLQQKQQQHKREQQRQKEKDRAAKLEARIKRLEEEQQQVANEKNKTVSEQVWRMLVKSRATGDRNLKMMDRLYFHCVVLRDDNDMVAKEYRYFSPQDTFAKIAGTFTTNLGNDVRCEVLCRQTINSCNIRDIATEKNQVVYRRFPVAMRVYEAVARGYLTEPSHGVETIVIRIHSDWEDLTPCVLDYIQEEESDRARKRSDDDAMVLIPESFQNGSSQHNDVTTAQDPTSDFEDSDLAHVIKTLDNRNDDRKQNIKKLSTATIKVKQMKIKSKAKGDTKRISNMQDRFFIELVVVSKNDGLATSAYYFLGKTDPLERILQFCYNGDCKSQVGWDFLVPTDNENCFRHITNTSMTTHAIEDQGILKSFGRLILRQTNL